MGKFFESEIFYILSSTPFVLSIALIAFTAFTRNRKQSYSETIKKQEKSLYKMIDSAKKLTDSTKIFSLLANFGDSKSLIIHPSSTTHQQLNEEQQKSTGVTSDLVRLSIGLEDPVDLIEDLHNAIKSL